MANNDSLASDRAIDDALKFVESEISEVQDKLHRLEKKKAGLLALQEGQTQSSQLSKPESSTKSAKKRNALKPKSEKITFVNEEDCEQVSASKVNNLFNKVVAAMKGKKSGLKTSDIIEATGADNRTIGPCLSRWVKTGRLQKSGKPRSYIYTLPKGCL